MATVKPNPFLDVPSAIKKLKDAIDASDEATLLEVLSSHDNRQRQEIKAAYKTAHGVDLLDSLRAVLGGNFEDVVVGLLLPSLTFDVYELRKAMQGYGTDEGALIEILCSRTNADIRNLAQAYEKEFHTKLEDELKSETDGELAQLLISQVRCNREEEQFINEGRAQEDAQAIYQAGESQLGTYEGAFMSILCNRSFPHIRAVIESYKDQHHKDLAEVIAAETSGHLQAGLLAFVKCAKNRDVYFADRLNDSIKGLGTDENALTRIIVSRCEIDLERIKKEFQKRHGQTVQDSISGDCAGDYKRLLLRLCGEKA